MRFDAGRLADSIPPEDRARMGQFLQDLHDRRTAAGCRTTGSFCSTGGRKPQKNRRPQRFVTFVTGVKGFQYFAISDGYSADGANAGAWAIR